MTRIPSFTVLLLAISGAPALAANLMFDFGPTTVESAYQTLSPGHNSGTITSAETSWNQISSSTQKTSLVWSNGTSASGVTLTMGEGSRTSSTITYNTAATFSGSMAGNGGGTAGQEKLTTDRGTSIYGPATGSSSPGLDFMYTTTNDTSIGARIDGLAAGNYIVYVMSRNTNTNLATGNGSNVYASAGLSSLNFNYSSLAVHGESNPGYASTGYVDQYGVFVDGENYVAIPVTVGLNESIFVAVGGQGTGSSGRGFINMLQIVQVPEPSACALLAGGFVLLGIRRRR